MGKHYSPLLLIVSLRQTVRDKNKGFSSNEEGLILTNLASCSNEKFFFKPKLRRDNPLVSEGNCWKELSFYSALKEPWTEE